MPLKAKFLQVQMQEVDDFIVEQGGDESSYASSSHSLSVCCHLHRHFAHSPLAWSASSRSSIGLGENRIFQTLTSVLRVSKRIVFVNFGEEPLFCFGR
jgi:hypothetical protein